MRVPTRDPRETLLKTVDSGRSFSYTTFTPLYIDKERHTVTGMSGKSRSVVIQVFKNFINSIKPRDTKGRFVGDDYHGNKFYEIAADPSRGKRRPTRWYVATDESKFDQETMTTEWEAWLRYRRDNPPTEEELKGNLTIAITTKENADKLDEKEGGRFSGKQTKHSDMSSFPVYDDYESTPGDKSGLK